MTDRAAHDTAEKQVDTAEKPVDGAERLRAEISTPQNNKAFPDAREKPTPGYSGPVFELSQDFPKNEPEAENYPWLKYDFKTQMNEYMQAVLDYITEGNIEVDFAGQKNEVRKWYHAPWLHYGVSGREFIHGLTMERNSRPAELANSQATMFQNWGVGMYNPAGGYTLGKVWRDPENPNTKDVRFPEGSVSFKLLFTEATEKEVPYLKGAPEWNANIYIKPASPMPEDTPKVQKNLRLLQIDVAIKDKRAQETGWVLGTFTYNSKMNNANPWKNLMPVGVAWGNDPEVTRLETYLGKKLTQQTLNSNPELPAQHLGWGGRLNGPVDNPQSGCVSCHSHAQWPLKEVMPSKQVEYDSKQWMSFFRNIKGGEAATPGHDSLDYSLQLAEGIKHFYEAKEKAAKRESFRH